MNGYEYHLDFGSYILVVNEDHLTSNEVVDRINEDNPTIKIIKSGSEESILDKTHSSGLWQVTTVLTTVAKEREVL